MKTLTFLLVSMLSLGSCDNPETDEPKEESPITWEDCGYSIGDHPCDFTLKDQNGDDWNLYENYGSIIILDFSTEGCGYCQIAASDAQDFQNAYKDDNVIYVTLMVEDSAGNSPPADGTLERWSTYWGLTAPVLESSREMIDVQGEAGWEVSGWPTFYFVDREMKIHSSIRGYNSNSLMAGIESMLVEEISEE